MIKLNNVPIRDLLALLNQISEEYELIDLVIDLDNKKVIINPVDPNRTPPREDEEELTEDNIYDII